jgi:hypothetical protein
VTSGPRRRPRRALLAAAVPVVAGVLAGCGSSSGEAADPGATAERALTTDLYCTAIQEVVALPAATVRRDRDLYVAAVAAVAASSPSAHQQAWEDVAAFTEDDASERLNPAADGLDRVGDEVEEWCGIDLVLVDWDLLRDRSALDTVPGPGS